MVVAKRLGRAAGLLLCAGAVGWSLCPGAMAQSGAPAAIANYPDFRKIVEGATNQVFPAVVYIKCIREYNEEGKKESQQVTGSGVIVSAEGEILTNWHVVDKAQSVRVLLSDGTHYDCKVIGTDKDTDVAVIQIQGLDKGRKLPHAKVGDSAKLKEGDFVMAMGAPYGLNRSVSIGIVSATRRFLPEISEYSLWIQTDAAINPGNSGGPLVNTAGEVVGLNARGMNAADGMGFAIPAETIDLLVPQMKQFGSVNWSWTGLQIQPLRDFNKDTFFDDKEGVIVSETDPESPARRAGFQTHDRIISVNGAAVTAMTNEDLPGVRRLLGLLEKGKEATLVVIRDGKETSLKLTPREKGKVEGEELALERFDMTVKTINQFDNPDLYFHRKEGVFVFAAKYPGNASNSGLGRNDIITKIDGKEVKTLDDVRAIHKELVANVKQKDRIVFTVLRKGLARQVVLDFSRDYSRE